MRGDKIFPMTLIALLTLFLAAPALAQDPYAQPDDTWISISGEVKAVSADRFTLAYDDGDGLITVEMDDGDRDADGYKLVEGDMVTVNGVIDDDFFEVTTIEASSVYVEKLDTWFYASAADEEDLVVSIMAPVVLSHTVLQGTVTETRGEEFVLSTGIRSITVEVEEMPYNPLDDEGYQKLEVGDTVRVTGQMDYDFLEGREFVADSVITLVD